MHPKGNWRSTMLRPALKAALALGTLAAGVETAHADLILASGHGGRGAAIERL